MEDERFFHLEIMKFLALGFQVFKKIPRWRFVSYRRDRPQEPKIKRQGVCAYLEDPERAEMEETESDDADADEAVPEAEGPPFAGWLVPGSPPNSAYFWGGCFELGVALKKRRRKTKTTVTL